jgi:hypothetical protein
MVIFAKSGQHVQTGRPDRQAAPPSGTAHRSIPSQLACHLRTFSRGVPAVRRGPRLVRHDRERYTEQ